MCTNETGQSKEVTNHIEFELNLMSTESRSDHSYKRRNFDRLEFKKRKNMKRDARGQKSCYPGDWRKSSRWESG